MVVVAAVAAVAAAVVAGVASGLLLPPALAPGAVLGCLNLHSPTHLPIRKFLHTSAAAGSPPVEVTSCLYLQGPKHLPLRKFLHASLAVGSPGPTSGARGFFLGEGWGAGAEAPPPADTGS
jgi:hypothetical protein